MKGIAAIVLAAGSGRRAGQPKLFLMSGLRTFLEKIILTLEAAGVADIVIVVSTESEERATALAGGHQVFVNGRPERGPLSSLRIGIDAVTGRDGYLVWPVDHPEVTSGTIRALAAAFCDHANSVIKPRCRGQAGHPVIITSSLASRVPGEDVPGGLAALIRSSGTPVTLVDVEDPGVARNINTKDDLAHGR